MQQATSRKMALKPSAGGPARIASLHHDAPLIGERAATRGHSATEGGERTGEPYSIPLSAFSRLAFACAFSQGS